MKPKLLDLFCGAGGASVGYSRAGFEVVGVDINPQPYYPFEFVQADAMTYPLKGFNAIHASPPCQAYSSMGNRYRKEHPRFLEEIIERFMLLNCFWIIENVPGARQYLKGAVVLSGDMFGLGVRRPRLFATNFKIIIPAKKSQGKIVGVYGKAPDGRRLWGTKENPTLRAASSIKEAQEAMGIDWVESWRGIAEAIPPAYTEYIGKQLLKVFAGRGD